MKTQTLFEIESGSPKTTLCVLLALSIALVAGCASEGRLLMPTPAVYQQEPGASTLFADTVPERRTPGVELLFITNRATETNPESTQPYGEGRSVELTFGTAVVDMVPGLTWSDLEYQSRLPERTKAVNLELGRVTEAGRFPPEPYDIEATAAGAVRSPAVLREHRNAKTGFQDLMGEQLRQSPSKEVVLYVHGFNETFASAAFTMGELCHFFGREHVCAIFTWPASASGGFLTSYTATTESATYSVSHLAKSIRMIAQTPGVKRVHLMAHSRGSAVLLNALRELGIEAIAAGVEPLTAFKIDNVVLFAPDIDLDVANKQMQIFMSNPDMITRWSGHRLPRFMNGRWTIYASPQDRALFVSRFLFRSRRRVGQLSLAEATDESTRPYAKWGQMDIVVYEGDRTDLFGHAYFATNPRVSSDLIQLIRYSATPGDPKRGLKKIGPVAWTFPGSDLASSNSSGVR
jgi:esterase/lipase superfamily enzyme